MRSNMGRLFCYNNFTQRAQSLYRYITHAKNAKKSTAGFRAWDFSILKVFGKKTGPMTAG